MSYSLLLRCQEWIYYGFKAITGVVIIFIRNKYAKLR